MLSIAVFEQFGQGVDVIERQAEHVLLAVTGSIAAYKAAVLASGLTRSGYEVRVVLTPGAARFVTPLTFEALTGNPAHLEVWEDQPGSSRMGHIELGHWADVLLVAPASASSLARLATGLADDLLGAVALATRAPLLLAPAMESAMFQHPATRASIATLVGRGATVVGPERGRLASGAEGEGRMSEPEVIQEAVRDLLRRRHDLAGHRIVITAGPTHEPIDRVRFLGNHSSGKMGYAIAREALQRGAEVVLISGPVALEPPPGAIVERVSTAEEMRHAVLKALPQAEALVMSAAVADFRPEQAVDGKLRRTRDLDLHLVPTVDIAGEAAKSFPAVTHVGFALEASDLLASARTKLERKGIDLVIANAIGPEHNPFGADDNRVAFVTPDGVHEFPTMAKSAVARELCDWLTARLSAR